MAQELQEGLFHQVIYVSGDGPPILPSTITQPTLQVRIYQHRDSADHLSTFSRRYDIIQTAMFEANTRALTTLAPLNFIESRSRNKLTADEDGPVG